MLGPLWLGSHRAGPEMTVSRPFDGDAIESLHVDGPEDVAQVAAALRTAQPAWEEMGVEERARWLKALRNWMQDNEPHLVSLLRAETGKPRNEAILELNWVYDIINTFTARAAGLLAEKQVRPHLPLLATRRFTVVRRPYQLVGVVGPWNFPIVLSLGDGMPALLAGAALLVKPSEITPLTVTELVRAWHEDLGAPPVIGVVNGFGETGSAVVANVDYIQFTGSVRTGQAIARQAAERLIPAGLELGGKDPFLVLDGANIDRAANAVVMGGFANNGQVCVGTERVYVEASVYDEFVGKVTDVVSALRVGAGPAGAHDLGAVTSPAQLSILDAHVADAVDKGAHVAVGGSRMARRGNWFEPTVLLDVDHSMRVMQEETFGPILPIMKVSDVDEAVTMANDSEFGLSAVVFGEHESANAVARRLEAGSVNINDVGATTMCLDVPMGGWKKSGIGARSADQGLLKYTKVMALAEPRVPIGDREVFWYPYSARKQRLMERGLRLVNARGIRRINQHHSAQAGANR